jgi:cbb3-type cytochrome oxidase subunit 3
MTKYLITLIVFLIAAMFFLYFREKKQNKVRELKRDPRTGTFTDI